MKKTLKRLILGFLFTLMIFSCGSIKKQPWLREYPLGSSMMFSCYITEGKGYQIDSIIVADTLPPINKWLNSYYADYETGESYFKRMYIKTLNDGTETVYLIIGSKEPYVITKRITKN